MDALLDRHRLVEERHFWFRGFRRFIGPVITEIAGARRDLRLLDCGCGTGYNLATLHRPYGRTFGFDLTASALTSAAASGSLVARGNLTHIPFLSDSFDIVTSFDVIQMLADDRAAMREIARVIRPGGSLILTGTAFEALRGGHAGRWSEVRRYSTARMRDITEAAGLRVDRLTYLFATLFPAMLAVRKLGLNEGGEDADWEMTVPPAPINTALAWMLRGEAAISRHVPMPVGSSVLVVARKP